MKMVNVDNLNSGLERSNDVTDLQQRLDTIMTEIRQLTEDDIMENDKIELRQDLLDGLNGQFADFLMGEDQKNLKTLQTEINILINDPELSLKAGPKLWKLNKFLDDISNPNRMKKDYDEFMDRIKNNPKSLNRMKSREIRRLNLYLGQNKEEALHAYKMMKSIVGKYAEKGMKSEDQKFFESVWDTLKNNYKNDETFVSEDYPQLKGESSVYNLRSFFPENRDGSSDKMSEIPENPTSIINTEKVKEVIKQKNNERISNNKNFVESIKLIDIVSKTDFKKSNDKIWYNNGGAREEFTSDKMIDLYKNNIAAKVASERMERFVNTNEIDQVINDSKDKIFGDLISDLLQANDVLTEDNRENHNEDNEQLVNTPVKQKINRPKKQQNIPQNNPEAIKDSKDFMVKKLNLKEIKLSDADKKRHGLNFTAPIPLYQREGHTGFYNIDKEKFVNYIPDFDKKGTNENVSVCNQRLSIAQYKQTQNEKWEKVYPKTSAACTSYLQKILDEGRANYGSGDLPKIEARSGKYYFISSGYRRELSLNFLTKGWMFSGKDHLMKDFKVCQKVHKMLANYKNSKGDFYVMDNQAICFGQNRLLDVKGLGGVNHEQLKNICDYMNRGRKK